MPVVKIFPLNPGPFRAIRWEPDGSNWREVMAFAGWDYGGDEPPDHLCDSRGDYFAPGDWLVEVEAGVFRCMDDRRLREEYGAT